MAFNEEFLKGLEADISDIQQAIIEDAKTAAAIVLESVVPDTPVKTGLHRGNWQVGIDYIPYDVLDTLDPSGAATIASGLETIAGVSKVATIAIVNNGPVIAELDEGFSQQAPAGFTDRAIAAATAGRGDR